MNNKITGRSLYPDIKFGQFRFLNVPYRVIQTKLLQEPVFAHCAPPQTLYIVAAHHTFVLQKMCSVACVLFLLQHTTHIQIFLIKLSLLGVRLLRGFLNCWAWSAGETTAEPLKGQLFSAMFLVSSNGDLFYFQF